MGGGEGEGEEEEGRGRGRKRRRIEESFLIFSFFNINTESFLPFLKRGLHFKNL